MHRLTAVLAAILVTAGLLTAPAANAVAGHRSLTNLAHLDALTTKVAPPAQPGHTTWRLATRPAIGVLWVYADHRDDGSYHPTGGGAYDAATNTFGQGAYDADDIARAAVVYLRHWQQWGDAHSRRQAFELLRGLTYLQTAAGPNAGNVVLWMQPDGTLNPSPTPKDDPDPSDSGASYWLARTIWALGAGYAAFHRADPAFARFLADRLDLAIGALHREVLVRYGQHQDVDGAQWPAWLIVNGADASAEAAFGLADYVNAGGPPAARTALRQLARGIAELGGGTAIAWPYGALLPWALSRSDWHAWAAQMPAALAGAATALDEPRLLRPAVADAASFTPYLLTATGPDNGLLPAPIDGSQIAYGADARVQSLLAVARATHSSGLRQLAGVAAGWFFGQNPAGARMYDPATGVTYDGVSADGHVNLNSGAESTIHGLLTMEALDAAPAVARLARESAHIRQRDGQITIEAEAATLTGDAAVVTADPAWAGESQWSGGAYVRTGDGSRLTWAVPSADQPRRVQAIVNALPGATAVTKFESGALGSVTYAGAEQGVSPAPGALLPRTVPGRLPGRATTLTATTSGGDGQLDAVQLTPLISTLVTTGSGHGTALLHSVAGTTRSRTIELPGSGRTVARSYDASGRLRYVVTGRGSVTVPVPPGGFAIAVR